MSEPKGLLKGPASKRTNRKGKASAELTVEIGRTIVAAITAGNFPSIAARSAGVSPGTLTKWLERGDKGEQPFADFAAAFRRAEVQVESDLVEIWRKAAPEDWRAAQSFLAKRHPERWTDRAPESISLGQNFQINIHWSDAGFEEQWRQQVQRRTLELAKKPEQLN